jgi:APA family basic amino acid/polyamine antiporter
MVASLSEEVIAPEKNMPVGIVGSLVVSTLIYVSVALCVVGMAPFRYLGETIPIVNALMVNACCSHLEQLEAQHTETCMIECAVFEKPAMAVVGHIVSGGAIFGLMAACFTSLMGQPRIFYRMAKDGLWFPIFAKVNPETQTMSEGIWVTGIVAAFMACFVPLEALANLISLGTLMVFTFVDAGVVLLRLGNVAEASFEAVQQPQEKERERSIFRTNHERVVLLLFFYTGSLLGASLWLANAYSKWPILLFVAVAIISGVVMINTPVSWTISDHHKSLSLHDHESFQCPLMPIVPLAGVGFNCFMMGSLPLSSWFLCMIWLGFGVTIYFAYGIHHSKLGQRSEDSDTVPLMDCSPTPSGETEITIGNGYGGTSQTHHHDI